MNPEVKKAALAVGFTEEQLKPILHRVVVTKRDGALQADYLDRNGGGRAYTGETLAEAFRKLREANPLRARAAERIDDVLGTDKLRKGNDSFARCTGDLAGPRMRELVSVQPPEIHRPHERPPVADAQLALLLPREAITSASSRKTRTSFRKTGRRSSSSRLRSPP